LLALVNSTDRERDQGENSQKILKNGVAKIYTIFTERRQIDTSNYSFCEECVCLRYTITIL